MKKNNRVRFIVLIVICAVITLVLFLLTFYKPEDNSLLTFKIKRRDLSQSIGAVGEVISADVYNISNTFPYEVEEYYVHNGDRVNVGDKLLNYSSKELDSQISEYTQLLEDARIQLEIQGINSDSDNAIIEASLEKARREYEDAKNEIESLKESIAGYQELYYDAVNSRDYYYQELNELIASVPQIPEEAEELLSTEPTTDIPQITGVSGEEIPIPEQYEDTSEFYENMETDDSGLSDENTESDDDYDDEESELFGDMETDDSEQNDIYESLTEKYELAVETAEQRYETYSQLVKLYEDTIRQYQQKLSQAQQSALRLEYTLNSVESEYITAAPSQNQNEQLRTVAQALVGRYEEQLESLNEQKKSLTVYSEYAGIVIMPDEESSDNILMSVIDDNSIQVRMKVSGDDVYRLKAGDEVIVTSDDSYKEITCIVSRIEKNSGNDYYAYAEPLEKYRNDLKTGMDIYGRFVIDKAENVMAVPYDAIHYEDNIPYIYIQRAGGYVKTEVSVTVESNYYIGVEAEGLYDEDIILIDVDKYLEGQ